MKQIHSLICVGEEPTFFLKKVGHVVYMWCKCAQVGRVCMVASTRMDTYLCVLYADSVSGRHIETRPSQKASATIL